MPSKLLASGWPGADNPVTSFVRVCLCRCQRLVDMVGEAICWWAPWDLYNFVLNYISGRGRFVKKVNRSKEWSVLIAM